MSSSLFEWIFKIDDYRLFLRARREARSGLMSKARRTIFQILVNREERSGAKSPESLEALVWLARIYFERAEFSLCLACSVLESRQPVENNIFRLNFFLSASHSLVKDLKLCRSTMKYALAKIEENSPVSEIFIRFQIARIILYHCLCEPGASDGADRDYLASAINMAWLLLNNDPGFPALDTVDNLVWLIYDIYFADASCMETADLLWSKSQGLRRQSDELMAQAVLYGRF